MPITAKYDGKCCKCHGAVRAGSKIDYDPKTKTVRHIACPTETQSGPQKLTARFDSPCIICCATVVAGSEIMYLKGKGSWHVGCDGKPAALNSGMPEQMVAPTVDLSALAAKYGRQIKDDSILSMMSSGATVGEIIERSSGKRLLVVAVGPARYYSRDYLEDMDMFDMRPGRYSDVQAVEVLLTPAEMQDAKDALAKKQRIEEVKNEMRASYSGDNHLSDRPVDAQIVEMYGAFRAAGSEAWYLGSDGAVYYCTSDYDMGPNWWRTSATEALILEAKALGVRP